MVCLHLYSYAWLLAILHVYYISKVIPSTFKEIAAWAYERRAAAAARGRRPPSPPWHRVSPCRPRAAACRRACMAFGLAATLLTLRLMLGDGAWRWLRCWWARGRWRRGRAGSWGAWDGGPVVGGARRAPLRASERRVAGVVLCEGLAAPVLGRFTAKVLFDCLFLWK